tara:strand:+ start:956 stop:1198 length:243 start_codon:yes stop_codon:yes gene_type:complete
MLRVSLPEATSYITILYCLFWNLTEKERSRVIKGPRVYRDVLFRYVYNLNVEVELEYRREYFKEMEPVILADLQQKLQKV